MSERCTYLLGAGGHGSVLLDALLSTGVGVVGIIDPAKAVDSLIFGIPVLGGDDFLERFLPSDILLVNGIGISMGAGAEFRARMFEKWKARGFDFSSVLHPSVWLARDVVLGEGCQVMSGAVLQCHARIGANAVINTRASVDHDCVIQAHAFVGPGAVLCGGVKVGAGAMIGAGATILPGVDIGDGALVGAGAVVRRDVSRGQFVAGNPATTKIRKSK